MIRTAALFGVLGSLVMGAGCTMTPTVTKARMTLGEANIEGMVCKRVTTTGTSIPKTVCASPEAWKRYDAKQEDRSERIIDDARDNNDNRVLYRNQ